MMKHLIQLSRLQEIPRKATEIQSNSRQKDVYKSQITRENLVLHEKEISPKNKRKIPSSPEEINKKKQKMVVTVKALHRQNQHIRHLKKPAKMIEKENIKGMARLQK